MMKAHDNHKPYALRAPLIPPNVYNNRLDKNFAMKKLVPEGPMNTGVARRIPTRKEYGIEEYCADNHV